MKKREIIIACVALFIATGGITYAVSNTGALHRFGGVTQKQYEHVVGTTAPKESIFDENGDLTKEAEEEYEKHLLQKERKIVSNVKNVKETKKMPRIKVIPAETQQNKMTEEGLKGLLESLMEKYAPKKKYDIRFVSIDDITNGKGATSKQNPFFCIIQDNKVIDKKKNSAMLKSLMMQKEHDDGARVPKENYTREKVLQEVNDIAQDCCRYLGGDYQIADMDTWEINEGRIRYDEEKGELVDTSLESEKGDMHRYGVSVYFSVAGYPLYGNAYVPDKSDDALDYSDSCLSITYAECGIQSMDIKPFHNYKVTDKTDNGIISYNKALKKLKEICETIDYRGGLTLEIQKAQLGYVWTGEEYLKPVWIFYGEKDNPYTYLGKDDPLIIMDALTGTVFRTPVFMNL